MELSLDRLTKQYGRKIAVDCVSATLKPGVYGLLVANGAGKTTLMRMLCAVLESTSGEVLLDGKEVTSMGADYRMFISAAVKNNVLTLLLSLAVVYGPMMIVEYLPYEMQKALDLIPLVGSSTDIFRTNTFRIFGKLIWSPYLLITIPVLIGILCMPFAIKSWSRRMKA